MKILRTKLFSDPDKTLNILGASFVALVLLLYTVLGIKQKRERINEEKKREKIKNFPKRETIEKSEVFKGAVEDLKKVLPKQYEEYKNKFSKLNVPYKLFPYVTSLEPNDYYMMLNLMVNYDTGEVSRPEKFIKKEVELFSVEPDYEFSILYNIETKTWVFHYLTIDDYEKEYEKSEKYRTWGEIKKRIIEEFKMKKQLWIKDYNGNEKDKGIKFFEDQINLIKSIN